MLEVLVGAEQSQIVAYAELGDQGVNGAKLHTSPSALISKFSGVDVIISVWQNESQRRKPLHDLGPSLWAGETLKQLLQDETRRDDHARAGERIAQLPDLWFVTFGVASQRERPYAGIDEQHHSRNRSAL